MNEVQYVNAVRRLTEINNDILMLYWNIKDGLVDREEGQRKIAILETEKNELQEKIKGHETKLP